MLSAKFFTLSLWTLHVWLCIVNMSRGCILYIFFLFLQFYLFLIISPSQWLMSAFTEAWLHWEPMSKGKKHGCERCLAWSCTRFFWCLDWFPIHSENCTSFWCTFVSFSSVLCKLTFLCGVVFSHEEKQWISWHLMTSLIGKQQVHSTKWKKCMQYWLTTKLHRCVHNGSKATTSHLASSKIYLQLCFEIVCYV